jgi:hypothetical protein
VGSGVPEEPSPPEDESEGGAVLAGGGAVSVELVSVEVLSVEPVSVEVSAELVSVEVSAELVAVAVAVELRVVVELSEDPVVSVDVELVRLVQLEIEVTLERSVPFRLVGRSLAGTMHVVVVFAPPVTFERDEVSVILVVFEAETAVELEAIARHAGGGVGTSLKESSHTLALAV